MTDELRLKMGDAAVKAAEYKYEEGAGTVNFWLINTMGFSIMEMNTRIIQVEHLLQNNELAF
jgi:acetyl-CoA carboxylase biotin carboxylase subunit